jgi:hypothetical protein
MIPEIKLPCGVDEYESLLVTVEGSKYNLEIHAPIQSYENKANAEMLVYFPIYGRRNRLSWLCGFLIRVSLLDDVFMWQAIGYTFGLFSKTDTDPYKVLSALVEYNLEGIEAAKQGVRQSDTMKLADW